MRPQWPTQWRVWAHDERMSLTEMGLGDDLVGTLLYFNSRDRVGVVRGARFSNNRLRQPDE